MKSIFGKTKQSLYEEIEPGTRLRPRQNINKCYQYIIAGVLFASVFAIVFLVFITNNGSTAVPIELLPDAAVVRVLEAPVPNSTVQEPEDIVVELEKGSVRGFKMVSRRGREFLAFRGIPFGKAPIGPLRFQPPEEIDPWDDILNATEFGPDCLQRSKRSTVIGSEDCLYLNVYTPKKYKELSQRGDYYPVLVFVHGGVMAGSPKRNSGEYFMDEDVVLVSITFRIGVLGKLNTNDSQARGNQANRDQVLGLRWVKDNIRKFGGDRRKVTLFGNSLGAMSISTHLLSPMTKGLFHRAICESGSSLHPEWMQRNPVEDAWRLGQVLGCNATNTTELVTCLRNTDAERLVLSSYLAESDNGQGFSVSWNGFATTVDPKLEGVREKDVYLPDTPLALMQNGEMKKMPIIIGINMGEGVQQALPIAAYPTDSRFVTENWETVLPRFLNLHVPNATQTQIVNSARDFYFGESLTFNITEDSVQNLTDLFTDRLYAHPAHTSAFYQKKANGRNDNVYLYYFTKKVEANESHGISEGTIDEEERAEVGPGHSDEVQFLFPYEPLIPLGSKNANFSQMMVRMWVSFARDGKPGIADNNVEWLPINKKPYSWFQLEEEPKMTNVLDQRMDFWDSFNLTDIYV